MKNVTYYQDPERFYLSIPLLSVYEDPLLF